MNEGAVTLSKEGIILYCNLRFAELVDEPIERVIGSYFKRFIVPDEESKFDKTFARQTFNKNKTVVVSLINKLYLKLSFQLLPAYLKGDYCVLVATDITKIKKEEEKLLELHRLLEQKLSVIERLRMQLIDKKIDNEVVINKLELANKKLVKEISRLEMAQAELKPKQTL